MGRRVCCHGEPIMGAASGASPSPHSGDGRHVSGWDDGPRRLSEEDVLGLLRNRDDGPQGRRFQMREKLASIGDDSWIEDDQGDRVYKVDGKAMRVRDTFVLEDASGNEVATIQEKKVSVRDKMAIERGDRTIATVRKALVGIRDRFDIDVEGGGG